MTSGKKPPLIWLNVVLFSVSFLLAIVAAPWYGFANGYGFEHWIWLLVLFSFSNLSITAGYHRLWSHKAYEANSVVRVIFALGGALALQNSILHWSSDHRVHHRHVDNNDKDPYSAKRGFWFSHIGWMLRDYNNDSYSDYGNCRDLQKDKVVAWQHKYYVPLAVGLNIAVPLLLGIVYQDIIGMFLIVGVVRLVLTHHTTFFINSLAHIWGSQPYTDKNTARDNGYLAILTFGEGYHNFHHIFENDYRNGIRWWQYDPTKWLISLLSKIGLASKLRRAPQIKIEKAHAAMNLQRIQKRLVGMPNAEALNAKVMAEFEMLVESINAYYALKKQMLDSKKEDLVKKYEHSLLKIRYDQLSEKLVQQRKSWKLVVEQYA